MKIAIIGSGAVGSYYGAKLAAAGEDVTFLLRSDYAAVKEGGLDVQSVDGSFHLEDVQCTDTPENIGTVDLVIIAWKTTSNKHYQSMIEPLLKEGTKILTLQNGLGNVELLADLFGADRIIGGLCFVCINRLKPGVISHTAAGLIRMGAHISDSRGFTDLLGLRFKKAGIKVEVVDDLQCALWMKLVWNIPFNGLAISMGGVDTQRLLHEMKVESRVRMLMHEVINTADALGYSIPNSFIDKQIDVTYSMGPYRPSSMIDYVEGRDVEVESIWEIPHRVAKAAGIEMPELEKLLEEIKLRVNS